MKNSIFPFGFLMVVAFGISSTAGSYANQMPQKANTSTKDTLQLIWETVKEFKKPECVFYNSKVNELYVSNINDTVRGDGFISKISPDGKIIDLKWITGLDNPCGMCIYKQKLYVADNKNVVEIDIKKGKIVRKFRAEDAKALNDIAIDSKGTLYISDFKGSSIYRMKGGKLEQWISGPQLKDVNGMLFDGNMLLAGTSTNIYSIDISSAKLEVFIERKGFVDGLSSLGDGRYIVSDWRGNITMVEQKKPDILIYSSVDKRINQADFYYLKSKKIIFSPNFSDNRVRAYSF